MKPRETESPASVAKSGLNIDVQKEQSYLLDIILVRAIFAMVLTGAAFVMKPFNLDGPSTIVLGLVSSLCIIYFERRLKTATLKRLIGAAIGSILGIIGAVLISHVLSTGTVFDKNTISFINVFILFLMTYVGLVVGANKGDFLNLAALGGIFGGERPVKRVYKIFDTSVIIDGRVADICETGFMDGILLIPHFVLRELQQVADSADALKRNRGRRGLDILQRIQKMAGITVQFVENDYPAIREVDMKLIELAKEFEAKIVTNDFNLNKVAQLRGVEVLNINELANALKPVYLPGETMKVFILKEGKEFNQGIAYLDDGTMVVVDNARKMIGKTIDSSVTSVLQTTAGKMIFGKYEERRGDVIHHPAKDERSDRGPATASERETRPTDRPASEVSH